MSNKENQKTNRHAPQQTRTFDIEQRNEQAEMRGVSESKERPNMYRGSGFVCCDCEDGDHTFEVERKNPIFGAVYETNILECSIMPRYLSHLPKL